MSEFIVIVENVSDAITATNLAERVLVETIEWLESENIKYHFQWRGLESGTDYSCWKNINDITDRLTKEFNFPIIRSNGKFKTDGQATDKIMKLIRFLQHYQNRDIKAVIFIRDLDTQPKRREHIEQVRSIYIAKDSQRLLEIVIGTANKKIEAWILNGFIAFDKEEQKNLEQIKKKLNFDPCTDSARLRADSFEEPERMRNPKVVLKLLTNGDREREKQCWEETSLEILKKRGVNTGLTDYINEIEQRLVPILESE